MPNFILVNTRNQSIGNRIRDGIAFGSRAVFWAKNPVTVATILRHTLDGITFIDTADIDGGNSDNPQRVNQLAVPDDGFLYLIADPGIDAGMGVWRTSNLVTITQRYGSLSLRATQYGGLGVIFNLFGPPNTVMALRTESLTAPVEVPQVYRDDGAAWLADPALPGTTVITAAVAGFDWMNAFLGIESRAVAQSAALRVFDVPGGWTTPHTAASTILRMTYWPAQNAVLYARSVGSTSPIHSTDDAADWVFTERWSGQFTGIVSDWELRGNDLLFATVDGSPTGANVRVYQASSLTSAPQLLGTITPANPALDSSAFLVWHPGMNKIFVTLQTLAGPARQEIYVASFGAGSKQKRLRLGH